jgi:hypothetical protein
MTGMPFKLLMPLMAIIGGFALPAIARPGYLNGRYWDECTNGYNPQLGNFSLCAANTQEYRLQYSKGISVQGRCGYPKFYLSPGLSLRAAQNFHAQVCGIPQHGLSATEIMGIDAMRAMSEALTRQYFY